jgi:hypothetical protein
VSLIQLFSLHLRLLPTPSVFHSILVGGFTTQVITDEHVEQSPIFTPARFWAGLDDDSSDSGDRLAAMTLTPCSDGGLDVIEFSPGGGPVSFAPFDVPLMPSDRDDTVVSPVVPTEPTSRQHCNGSLPPQLDGLAGMKASDRLATLQRFLHTRSQQMSSSSAAMRYQTRFLRRSGWPGFRKEADDP